MRIEDIPIVLGGLVLAVGAAIVWDAWGPQTFGPMRDRRRRERADVNRTGEAIAGFGIALLGVALIGRDWRYETPTVIAGTICVIIGALKNRKYFWESFMFRGAARRNKDTMPKKIGRLRIR